MCYLHVAGKGQCWDGGVRMPTIVSWPGHIPAGTSLHELTSSMDVLPTIAKLTGADIPEDRVIDGKNLLPLLTNKTRKSPHEFLFHYCGDQVHAVRYRPKSIDTVWKAHFMTPKWTKGTESCIGKAIVCRCHGDRVKVQDPPLLFDVTNDPSESSPIAVDRREYKDVMKDIYPSLITHKESIKSVPSQLGRKNFFHTQLQMCCNFPFCRCKEAGRKLEHYFQ